MKTIKAIITSKQNLQSKYDTQFRDVEAMLGELVKSDSNRGITTYIIYIDDPISASNAGITAVTSVTRQSAKQSVDDVFKKLKPAYIVLFGSQDIFPFQEIDNPCNDDDGKIIPSDLPYACDSAYNKDISSFIGPTRVVGRIPDIPGVADLSYLKIIFEAIISYKKVKPEKLMDYFSVTAEVWKKSTQMSLNNIFGNSSSLKNSPSQNSPHSATDLKPLTHFYNCHGSSIDSKFYGQNGNNYPTAQYSADLVGKISKGTVVAAECCFGAEVFDPSNEGTHNISIASAYFKNEAIAFMGSSTIAYGPSSGNSLADLITQYFMKNVINGASTGRALLEARQKFLSVTGPHLDPYELKTLAQFYLLGDPSIQVAVDAKLDSVSTVENRRLNLFNKGLNLADTLAPSKEIKIVQPKLKDKKTLDDELKKIFDQTGFTGEEKEIVYEVEPKNKKVNAFAKGFSGTESIIYRVFIQKPQKTNSFSIFNVLVLKENGDKMLGWKLYHRK
ncbi:hypothetical protein H9Q08_19765 [Chryseobacterium sp. PS-8]|uniref:Gingipain domain-containing protein n=1 Tax=Chryseobacterium indicum TaxID=2766954 RepID=A0ABS9CAA1_9FLAO|nr:C25 family cysteine peptidase [Chryseobacterium sp. PS-8]MCF2221507.1 hypothetical protein [Chryseobacterium sp. PS-8]